MVAKYLKIMLSRVTNSPNKKKKSLSKREIE